MATKIAPPKKKKNWKDDNVRFICFLDIMGFKDMVYFNDHNEVKKTLLSLSEIKQGIDIVLKALNSEQSTFPQYKNCEIKSISFSDSIIFFTNDDKPSDLELLTITIKRIFKSAIKLGVPLKGSIAYGLLTANFDKSIFFGKPLITSYLLQEELNYYGVIMDNKTETFLNENKKKLEKLYFSIKTPLKKGRVIHANLSLIDEEMKKEDYESLYKTVSGSTRIYVDNTIEMFESMKKIEKGI